MAAPGFQSTDERNYIRSVHARCTNLIASKNYRQAAELIKEALSLHPEQKEFLILREKLKREVVAQKVKELEQEALLLMQMGDEDKAQGKFRQILKLDPTRTEYGSSMRKTKQEVLREYHQRLRISSFIRFCLGFALLIVVVMCLVSIWLAWSNNRYLNRAERFIENKNYSGAWRALSSSGDFFYSKRKAELKSKLAAIADEGWQLSLELDRNEDFEHAIEVLTEVAGASAEPDIFAERIESLKYKQQQKKLLLERQQKVKKAALGAQKNCDTAARKAMESGAQTNASELWQQAEKLTVDARESMNRQEYEKAQSLWAKASEKYEEAKISSIRFEDSRREALAANQKCQNSCDLAKGACAQSEAEELWRQAEAANRTALEKFESSRFPEAKQNWLEAAKIYEEAAEAAKDSPLYNKAVLYLKKWKNLKLGMSEQHVYDLLGYPRMKLGGSQQRIWYYQRVPEVVSNGDARIKLFKPDCGYVLFEPVSVEVILERIQQSYDEMVAEKNRMFAESEESIEKIHQDNLKDIREGLSRKTVSEENERYTKAVESAKLRHEQVLRKYKKKYDQQVDELVNGLQRELNFVVADWLEPDMSDAASLVLTDESEDNSDNDSKKEKWHVPQRWRKLQLNASESSVTMLLGLPKNMESTGSKKAMYYGDVEGYGVVIFTMTDSGVYRLSYWQEPFWPAVK
jgi:hypothetical protein